MDETTPKKSLSIPFAIIIAGVLIAGAVFITKSPGTPANNTAAAGAATIETIAMRQVSAQDHILGNPNAQIVIVEYSDLECPFCKTFHNTLHDLMDEYGKTGQLAWVYRQFPLGELHRRAASEAAASECAAEQGGNTAFWKFIDEVFRVTPSNDGLDPAILPQIAQTVGLNVTAFNSCLSSNKYAEKVKDRKSTRLNSSHMSI